MTFLKLKTPIKHVNTFSISLLAFITKRSHKPKLELNSRAIRTLGLLKVLQIIKKETETLRKILNKIPNASKPFDSLSKVNTSMESQWLSINELKDAFST